MIVDFEDIRITGLDASATQESGKGTAMRLMHLTLSQTPPAAWATLFDQERSFPRHSMWRRAWVQGGRIIVDCVPDEIEKTHLADLKQDVASCNVKYRDFLARAAAADEKEQRDEAIERQRIDALASRLNFD